MKKRFLAALTAFIILAGPGFAIAQAATQQVSVSINWQDNSNNEDGFDIERGGVQAGPFNQLIRLGTNVTNYVDVIAADPGGSTYCYRVKAYNAAGSSPYSNVACLTTPVIQTVPLAPTTLKCTATVNTGSQTLSSVVCQ